MSLFNGFLSTLLKANNDINDPFRVVEVNAEDYKCYSPVCRNEHLVLYKTGENESLKLDIVFQSHIHHSIKKAFSLFRTSEENSAECTYLQMSEKLPVLVECCPEIASSKTMLQEMTQLIRDHPTWSSCHIASHYGCLKSSNTEIMKNKVILSEMNDVCTDTMDTPLHVAIKAQQMCSITALIALDVRLDIVNNDGDSVLHCAAVTTKEIIQALAVNSVAAVINFQNHKGFTALHLACNSNKPDCVIELLRCGADVNIGTESVNYDDFPDVDMTDAAQKSMKEILDTRSHQFYFNDIKNGGNPLHWSKTPELLEVLLEHGCNVDACDFKGDSALHVMVQHNRLTCAVMLLSHRANVDVQGEGGNTPLHYAVKGGDITFVHLLVAFGADVNLMNNKGETARHIASTEKKSNYGELIYALHVVGASRCSRVMLSCQEGCVFAGQFNGIPPENLLIADQSELFEEMLKEITKSDGFLHKVESAGDQKRKCRVLTLDGGGIRGLVLIQLLYELEKVIGLPIVECFDWITGTSTGGILALVLASGKNIKETRCIYFQLKGKVFVGSRPYDADSLETILKRELGSTTVMADILRPRVMLTATKGDRKPAELHMFRNYPSPLNILGHQEVDTVRNNDPIPPPSEQLVWQAARATGAAPTYFRAFGQYLDGGLVANNPTLDALTEIHQCNQALQATNRNDEVVEISCLVSLGTGKCPLIPINQIDVFRPDSIWGACKMALGVTALGQLLIDQATQTDGRVITRAHSLCSMLNIPFIRINPQLSEAIALDETDDRILAKALWETTAYMYSIREHLESLAILLKV